MFRFTLVLWFAFALHALTASPARAADSSAVLRAPLDLDVVQRRALERNPSLAAIRAARDAAGARARQAGALEDPMVGLMAAPRSFGSALGDPAWRVDVSQPLPLFGQRGLRRRSGRAEHRAAVADVRMAQLDLLQDVRDLYFEIWRIGRAMDATRDLQGLMNEFRRASLARYAAGTAGQQDPLQADAEIAMLDHQAVVLERERRIAVARLDVLMHDSPERELPPAPRELAVPDTVVDAASLLSRALRSRPELHAADAMVDASRAGLALARRESWPMTSVGFVYDRYMEDPAMRPSLTLSATLPLHFGRLAAGRSEAAARLAGDEARRDAVRDSIALDVEQAAARLQEQAHDLAIVRDRLVPLAERTMRAARAGYEAGHSDFLTLLNSVRDLLRARLEADESFAMLHQARAELDRALGEPAGLLDPEERP